jgi:hypothetical protein
MSLYTFLTRRIAEQTRKRIKIKKLHDDEANK